MWVGRNQEDWAIQAREILKEMYRDIKQIVHKLGLDEATHLRARVLS